MLHCTKSCGTLLPTLAPTPNPETDMFDQLATPFAAQTRQFADAALKANALTLSTLEQIVNLQVKTFEDRFAATLAFFGEAGEVRDPEALKAFLPKSAQLAKDNAETAYHTSQEIFNHTLKTQEALAELVKEQFEAVNEEIAKVNPAAKAPRKAAAAK